LPDLAFGQTQRTGVGAHHSPVNIMGRYVVSPIIPGLNPARHRLLIADPIAQNEVKSAVVPMALVSPDATACLTDLPCP
jgi:hypothetical protein